MRRKILLLAISIFLQLPGEAQNLVLNPGLDSYITCPGFGQFSDTYINNWDKPSWGSTDYYNYNCPGIIPSQQTPRSDSAYAGIIGYNYGQEYREYMTGMLNAPLIPGATYYCEFYVSLNDGYIQAIKELGAYFSASAPSYANTLHLPVTPHIQNNLTLLDDTSNWLKVSGYFLASGGEQYITIGNLMDDAHTTIVQVGNSGSYGSYYFVDDVWVSLAEGTGIAESENGVVNIFPNPAADRLNIHSNEFLFNEVIVELYDIFGKKIVSEKYLHSGNEISLNVSDLLPGMYLAEITQGDKTFRKKFIKE